MGTNKVKGVITLVIGLVLIIVALVILLVTKEANWVVGGIGGIGVTDLAFSIPIMFQKTESEIIERYIVSQTGPNQPHVDENKETVQFVSPEEIPDTPMNFDPNTGEPIK